MHGRSWWFGIASAAVFSIVLSGATDALADPGTAACQIVLADDDPSRDKTERDAILPETQ